MSVPDAVLKGMRETNDLFCTKAIRSRDMNVLDHVYTPDAHILPYRNYVVLYRNLLRHVSIARIVHGARDIMALLGDPD